MHLKLRRGELHDSLEGCAVRDSFGKRILRQVSELGLERSQQAQLIRLVAASLFQPSHQHCIGQKQVRTYMLPVFSLVAKHQWNVWVVLDHLHHLEERLAIVFYVRESVSERNSIKG